MNNNSTSGVGFFGLLFITFLVMKLTDVIDWSWWWITAPLWGTVALFLLATISALVFMGGLSAFDDFKWRKKK